MTEREASEHLIRVVERVCQAALESARAGSDGLCIRPHDLHDLMMAAATCRVLGSDERRNREASPPLKGTTRQCDRCRGSGFDVPPGRPDVDGGPCGRCSGTGRV